jgi:hypothetical protein
VGPAARSGQARIAIHVEAERGKASQGGGYAICEPGGAVPLDLALSPGARPLVQPLPPLWRPDDTRCFAVIAEDGVLQPIAAAAMLYRRLAGGEIGLADLQPGEGFSTWDGSPLWLTLAGIEKPRHSAWP